MALQHKYALDTLDQMYGNDVLMDTLVSYLERPFDEIPRVYLFSGIEGTGKTALAKAMASTLKCSKLDIIELDASSDRGIDSIRSLKQNVGITPLSGDVKAIILDEVHGVTPQAQEAMLKMLNDAPKHCFFFLCTTEPEKLKPTIIRRCHQFELKTLTQSTMMGFLKDICEEEDMDDKEIESMKDVLKKIQQVSNGSAGTALKYLDMVITTTDYNEAIELISNVTYNETTVKIIVDCLLSNEKDKWDSIRGKLKDIKGNPESTRMGILNYLNAILLNTGGPESVFISVLMSCFLDSVMYSGAAGLNGAVYAACRMDIDVPF